MRWRVAVTVDKVLRAVADADSPDPMVQTHLYSYNVSVSGRGSAFRYDNAHRHPGHSDPNHRHEFDWKTGAAVAVRWIGRDWPTLGEVIQEARTWYWANHDDLANV